MTKKIFPLILSVLIIMSGLKVATVTSNKSTVENKLPTELIIEGPTDGIVGISYEYTFYLIDPDIYDFWLYIDWDDGHVEEWIGPYPSGEKVTITHTWNECGIYTIQAVTRDYNDSQYYATLNVTIASCNGNIFHVGGTGQGNYTMIQNAINDASDGDTIFVYDDSSPYYENVVVNKSINLIGENKTTTIIDGNETGDVIHISVDYVNVTSFTLKNSSYDVIPFWGAGIDVRSNFTLIENNIFVDNRYGIHLDNACNNIINGNIIINSSYLGKPEGAGIHAYFSSNSNNITENTIINGDGSGIFISNSDGNNIFQNNITNHQYGICLIEASNNTVNLNSITKNSFSAIWVLYSHNDLISENNIFNNKEYGILVTGSNHTTISENTLVNCSWVIVIESSYYIKINDNNISDNNKGIDVEYSSTLTILTNYICNNPYGGIDISHTDNNNISGNTFINNYNGIRLKNSPNNVILRNTFIKNTRGIDSMNEAYNTLIVKNNFVNNSKYGIHISSENNAVYHNNFLNNTQNIYGSYYNTKWDNGYPSGGNYWDDYDGVDEDPEDGIGDTPYKISNYSKDKYPFMEPSGWDKNYPPFVDLFGGTSYGQPGIPYEFKAGLFDPDKDLWYVMFDWGDNSYSVWRGPFSNGEEIGLQHTWSKGVYNIRIKGKDIHGVESNWSEPIKLRIESDPPTVEIIKPDKALYILNKKIIPRFIRWPLIIGTIDVTVVANDFTGIDKVEFYVDNELKSVDNSSPYIYTWIRDRLRFIHFHVLKVVAYDYVGNIASDKIIVRKFF